MAEHPHILRGLAQPKSSSSPAKVCWGSRWFSRTAVLQVWLSTPGGKTLSTLAPARVSMDTMQQKRETKSGLPAIKPSRPVYHFCLHIIQSKWNITLIQGAGKVNPLMSQEVEVIWIQFNVPSPWIPWTQLANSFSSGPQENLLFGLLITLKVRKCTGE